MTKYQVRRTKDQGRKKTLPPLLALLPWYFVLGTWYLPTQVEDDEAAVFEQAGEAGAEVPVEAGVVVEPPEGRPGEGEVAGAGAAEAVQFADGGVVVGRRPPVLAVALQ